MTTATPNPYEVLSRQQRAQAATMGETAEDVALHLGKKEYSWNDIQPPDHAYREDRIVVEHSTHLKNVKVQVRVEGGSLETVYYGTPGNYQNPHIFRTGRWTEYMFVLAARASEARRAAQRELDRIRYEDREMLYSPVNDADAFSDLDDATEGPDGACA